MSRDVSRFNAAMRLGHRAFPPPGSRCRFLGSGVEFEVLYHLPPDALVIKRRSDSEVGAVTRSWAWELLSVPDGAPPPCDWEEPEEDFGALADLCVSMGHLALSIRSVGEALRAVGRGFGGDRD